MITEFKDGKKYRFSKKLHADHRELVGINLGFGWPDEIDGVEIIATDKWQGVAVSELKYDVVPEWCEEVTE